MWQMLISPITNLIDNVLDKIIPDAAERDRLKAEINREILNSQHAEMQNMAKIILAEAEGESWIQRTWRPIMMLWFAALVGAYWFGFTPENMPEEVVERLFMIVQYGLSGYILGRSGEKIVREWKK